MLQFHCNSLYCCFLFLKSPIRQPVADLYLHDVWSKINWGRIQYCGYQKDRKTFWEHLRNPLNYTLLLSQLMFVVWVFHIVLTIGLWIQDLQIIWHTHLNSSILQPHLHALGKLVANVTIAIVALAGYGDIYLSSKVILKNVLHVPKLSTSFISIKKTKIWPQLFCNAFPVFVCFTGGGLGEEDWTC